MSMPAHSLRHQPKGHDRPRIAPPIPARSGVKAFAEFSASLGIKLRPWQETAARYLTAEAPGGLVVTPRL